MSVLKPRLPSWRCSRFLRGPGSAAADKGSFTSLVEQLDDPLMKEIIGSIQAQMEIERKEKVKMQTCAEKNDVDATQSRGW
jgi:hypothetical protein